MVGRIADVFSDAERDGITPAELFDTVSENILENLREKAKLEPTLHVDVCLNVRDDTTTLTITDNGTAIEEETARALLKEPVDSENGLGIGLYQASELAHSLDYKLVLEKNVDREVRFQLCNA